MKKRYKVYNTNESGKSSHRSYIGGYVEGLNEARIAVKQDLKLYPKKDLELHLVDFDEKFIRKVKTKLL